MDVRMLSNVTDEELISRLSDHEDHFTERKSAGVKPAELRQTLCAFSNSLAPGATAVLLIGVHDKSGAVEGIKTQQVDNLEKRVREAAAYCYPPIMATTCRVLPIEGKVVVAVLVGASDNRPHFTGPAFVRRGSESVNASADLFNELIPSRNDTTARILHMRDKNKPVSVQWIGRRLGDPRPLADSAHRESCECLIESCDAHVVRMRTLSDSRRISEPLSVVQISYDEEKWRDMLIVMAHPTR